MVSAGCSVSGGDDSFSGIVLSVTEDNALPRLYLEIASPTGYSMTFVLEITRTTVSANHLRAHQRTGVPVTVRYKEQEGQFMALSVVDAQLAERR